MHFTRYYIMCTLLDSQKQRKQKECRKERGTNKRQTKIAERKKNQKEKLMIELAHIYHQCEPLPQSL